MSSTAAPQNRTPNDRAAELTALLPALPPKAGGDGYDWMEAVQESPTGWRVVPGFSLDEQLGDWPYYIVVFHDAPDGSVFGLGVYIEGDIEVSGYATRAERNRAARAHIQED